MFFNFVTCSICSWSSNGKHCLHRDLRPASRRPHHPTPAGLWRPGFAKLSLSMARQHFALSSLASLVLFFLPPESFSLPSVTRSQGWVLVQKWQGESCSSYQVSNVDSLTFLASLLFDYVMKPIVTGNPLVHNGCLKKGNQLMSIRWGHLWEKGKIKKIKNKKGIFVTGGR